MFCISFEILSVYIYMYHSVVKVKKNRGVEFFKIKLQSSICIYTSDICLQKVVIC